MKILLVSSYLPYPLHSGGHIRLYNLLKHLGKENEITLICEKRSHQTNQDIDEVSKVCNKVIAVERRKAWSFYNIIKTAFSLNSFLLTGHSSKEFKRAIKDEIKTGNYDLVHVETFYVMQNLPDLKIPTVLVEHNIEYKVYGRYARKANLLLRPILLFDVAKLKRKEEFFWKKTTKLVSVSSQEKKLMGRSDVEVVPNGVDTDKFNLKSIKKGEKRKTLLFIGDFKWVQNKDSAVYLIKNIWPKLLAQKKDLELNLWIVGKRIPDSIKVLKTEGIRFDENAAEETEEIFQNADLLTSPIRVGGGTKFKILESMASGTPVLTTSLGNEGINAKEEEQIFICEKPEEYVESAVRLLTDEYLYEKVSKSGRKFIEENFDWKQIAMKLQSVYHDAIN